MRKNLVIRYKRDLRALFDHSAQHLPDILMEPNVTFEMRMRCGRLQKDPALRIGTYTDKSDKSQRVKTMFAMMTVKGDMTLFSDTGVMIQYFENVYHTLKYEPGPAHVFSATNQGGPYLCQRTLCKFAHAAFIMNDKTTMPFSYSVKKKINLEYLLAALRAWNVERSAPPAALPPVTSAIAVGSSTSHEPEQGGTETEHGDLSRRNAVLRRAIENLYLKCDEKDSEIQDIKSKCTEKDLQIRALNSEHEAATKQWAEEMEKKDARIKELLNERKAIQDERNQYLNDHTIALEELLESMQEEKHRIQGLDTGQQRTEERPHKRHREA